MHKIVIYNGPHVSRTRPFVQLLFERKKLKHSYSPGHRLCVDVDCSAIEAGWFVARYATESKTSWIITLYEF